MISNIVYEPIVNKTKTVNYTDINTDVYTNTILLFTVPQDAMIVGMGCTIEEPFVCKEKELTFTVTDTLIDPIETFTSLESTMYQKIQDPFIWQDAASYDIYLTGVLPGWVVASTTSVVRRLHAGCGLQNAALSFCGIVSGQTIAGTSAEYDGTTWTAGGTGVARWGLGGCGLQNAGLSFGGHNGTSLVNTTQEYDGSTWTNGGPLVIYDGYYYYCYVTGCGLQDAGLIIGGKEATGARVATVQEYNGTSWVKVSGLSKIRADMGSCGIQDAALAFGGTASPPDDIEDLTEEYNGTTWSTGGNLITPRRTLVGCGTQTAGLSFGGAVASGTGRGFTEKYDGSTWSSTCNLNYARLQHSGAGAQTSGLCDNGFTGNIVEWCYQTEEYSDTNLRHLTSGSMEFILKYLRTS